MKNLGPARATGIGGPLFLILHRVAGDPFTGHPPRMQKEGTTAGQPLPLGKGKRVNAMVPHLYNRAQR